MKLLFLALFAVMFLQICNAQKVEVYFGESDRLDYAYDVIETYDQGYFIAAGFESEFGWGIKTDKNLNLLYEKVIEFNTGNIATSQIASDDEGNVYLGGFTDSSLGQWPFVSKINACGEPEWCRILPYEDEFDVGWVTDIIVDEDLILLLTNLNATGDISEVVHIIGLDLNGQVLWTKPFASENNFPLLNQPIGHSFIELNENIYISGYCYYAYPEDPHHFYLRSMFIGIDENFEEKWILPFGHMDSVLSWSENSIPLNDTLLMGVGIRKLEESKDNSLLMFYTTEGVEVAYNEIYNEQIGPNINSNWTTDIEKINDTLFITSTMFGSDFSVNPGGALIIDTAGSLYNYQSRPNTTPSELIKTNDNIFIFAADYQNTPTDWDIYLYKIDENLNDVPFDPTPHNYDTLCPDPIPSGTIDLTDCLVWVDIGEAPTPNEYYDAIAQIPLTPYPSPTTGNITIAMGNTQHHQNIILQVYDLFGQLVKEERIFSGQEEMALDVTDLQSGMYHVAVFSKNIMVGRTTFVIK